MNDPLFFLREMISGEADAVHWACVLESTSPKPGNVYPGRSFADLQHSDFVLAAQATAQAFSDSRIRVSRRMLAAIRSTRAATGTNVNLGIVLLMGPLVAASERLDRNSRSPDDWKRMIARVLEEFDDEDGANIYAAIAAASPGGLGRVDSMDANEPHEAIDIRSAMKSAMHRDRIALQYATDFADLLDSVVPMLTTAMIETGDTLSGIMRAHVRLLATAPDSLIGRKCGIDVADRIKHWAKEVDVNSTDSIRTFDRALRDDDHRFNPGTTADLIAAALFVLLCGFAI